MPFWLIHFKCKYKAMRLNSTQHQYGSNDTSHNIAYFLCYFSKRYVENICPSFDLLWPCLMNKKQLSVFKILKFLESYFSFVECIFLKIQNIKCFYYFKAEFY